MEIYCKHANGRWHHLDGGRRGCLLEVVVRWPAEFAFYPFRISSWGNAAFSQSLLRVAFGLFNVALPNIKKLTRWTFCFFLSKGLNYLDLMTWKLLVPCFHTKNEFGKKNYIIDRLWLTLFSFQVIGIINDPSFPNWDNININKK